MSGNAPASRPKADPRIRRSRDRLGDALIELIQQRPFDEITVQHVLDRAGVSRSTFYSHYRDKDDLFLSDVDEFLEMMANKLTRCGDPSQRVAPVREFFAHVGEARQLYTALVASGRIHAFMDLAREHFARAIAQRLAEQAGDGGAANSQRTAFAQALAGALLALLSWWITSGKASSPAEMDQLFHRMVRAGSGGGGDAGRAGDIAPA